MKNDDIFVCPKCGSKFIKDSHYISMINMQNFIITLSNGNEIKHMCMKCKYKEYQNENKI